MDQRFGVGVSVGGREVKEDGRSSSKVGRSEYVGRMVNPG